jgi:hypothetical protein
MQGEMPTTGKLTLSHRSFDYYFSAIVEGPAVVIIVSMIGKEALSASILLDCHLMHIVTWKGRCHSSHSRQILETLVAAMMSIPISDVPLRYHDCAGVPDDEGPEDGFSPNIACREMSSHSEVQNHFHEVV